MLIDDTIDWVDGYRGLFGLDTYDRFAGERAPAGPKYTRSGTVRQSWNDPLGFAGLDKMAPPSRQPAEIGERIARAGGRGSPRSTAEVERLTAELPGLTLEVRALVRVRLHRGAARGTRRGAGGRRDRSWRALRARRAAIGTRWRPSRRERAALEAGDLGDPQRHLQHPHRPVPPEETRYNVIVELWSAVSVGVLLLLVAGLVFFRLVPWWGAAHRGRRAATSSSSPRCDVA